MPVHGTTSTFIMDMRDGYLTRIGERGCTLSGGQRQRISIARAILKDPRILILDEATSQVDNESERAMREAPEGFRMGNSTVIIANRLSTIEKVDLILVLHEGRVVEQGQHRELLARGGGYREPFHLRPRIPRRGLIGSTCRWSTTTTTTIPHRAVGASSRHRPASIRRP